MKVQNVLIISICILKRFGQSFLNTAFSYRGEFDLNNININNSQIEYVGFVKYLGVFLDKNLRFDEHLRSTSTRVARSIGVLNKMREVLPTPVLKMLYFALVHPYFNYCSTVWGSSAMVQLWFILGD